MNSTASEIQKQYLFEIIYEDHYFIVINKPSGLSTQPDKSGKVSLLELLNQSYENIELVHRLDQRVSGLVLFAKNKDVASKLNLNFQQREVIKKYRAIVLSKPTEITAKLTHWLLKDGRKNFSRAFDKEVKNSQKAELIYRVVASS